jgi:hypothetical protein
MKLFNLFFRLSIVLLIISCTTNTKKISKLKYPGYEEVTFRDPLKWPFSSNSIWNTPIGF